MPWASTRARWWWRAMTGGCGGGGAGHPWPWKWPPSHEWGLTDIRTVCSNEEMRWDGQQLGTEHAVALPGLARLNNLVRCVQTPEFAGVTFHEVLAKSALNRVPRQSQMPFGWTINPYRGCSHACVYCLDPDTLILMADGRQKPLKSVAVGDSIMGTQTIGSYRRYVATTVLAHGPQSNVPTESPSPMARRSSRAATIVSSRSAAGSMSPGPAMEHKGRTSP